jgi:hypothetical protein
MDRERRQQWHIAPLAHNPSGKGIEIQSVWTHLLDDGTQPASIRWEIAEQGSRHGDDARQAAGDTPIVGPG